MTHLHLRRPAVLLVIAALAALCLAACGSSSNTSSTSSSSAASAASGSGRNSAARTKLVACLKAHGVTLPTRRPGAGGGYGGPPPGGGGAGAPGAGGYGGGGPGFFGGGRSGGADRFSNPKFRAAFQACGGRAFGGARRAQFTKTAITKFVACVKQHGYTLPRPNFSGGPIFPVSVERNAKFQTASKSCASLLRPTGAPPAGGGAPSGSASGGGTTTS